MTTSPTRPSPSQPSQAPAAGDQLRMTLYDQVPAGGPEGAWWPRSRNLQDEASALVDQFPHEVGRIDRMLFSRPDWDDGVDGVDGTRGLRRIAAARGPVKVGSFPRDDTHLLVLSMADGRRLRLQVVPSDTAAADAQSLLAAR